MHIFHPRLGPSCPLGVFDVRFLASQFPFLLGEGAGSVYFLVSALLSVSCKGVGRIDPLLRDAKNLGQQL